MAGAPDLVCAECGHDFAPVVEITDGEYRFCSMMCLKEYTERGSESDSSSDSDSDAERMEWSRRCKQLEKAKKKLLEIATIAEVVRIAVESDDIKRKMERLNRKLNVLSELLEQID